MRIYRPKKGGWYFISKHLDTGYSKAGLKIWNIGFTRDSFYLNLGYFNFTILWGG